MEMNPKRLDLTNFGLWITTNFKLRASTIRIYTSLIRSFLRDREAANSLITDPKRFADYAVEHDADLSDQGRPVFRAALRAFTSYVEATKGGLLPVVFPDGRRRDQAPREPHPLGPLLREVERRQVPLRCLFSIRWRDVATATEGEPVTIRDVERRANYALPYVIVKALNFWAGGGTWAERDQPLIPYEPKGKSPMSTRRMKRIARS